MINVVLVVFGKGLLKQIPEQKIISKLEVKLKDAE